jgi:pimeloyl-ACP methyl ester carboxylesterase
MFDMMSQYRTKFRQPERRQAATAEHRVHSRRYARIVAMSRFASYDGTEIEFRRLGEGRPLVCLPGGPGRASEYLGDLGGLSGSGAAVRAAELFPSSKVVVQPGTAHYPWLDDPAWFRSAIDSFLG